MQLIPILVVEDDNAALDFYTKVFQADIKKVHRNTTQISVQGYAIAIRKADDRDACSDEHGIILLIETAAPDVLAEAAIKHGAEKITDVDDHETGIRAGRIRDPFGFQWILSTPAPL
ncbi:hypothetical protein EJ997_09630 [Flaviflexus ciconiae]|uniref:Glyoxalase/fosfomycin resistance/dioxygenase domain-containing protein n=1 Tax=Flaviflexus ciconiae TaxID=2496867 RepID=A0A3S9PZ36_9ACTO|nr:VOC family protein [Flaviflexus ciconiae]AZQ77556.1 hypothetical protein EJ997_09630 [Flaviflexus ciconiae]